MIEIGAKDTVQGFTEGLRGASPGEERDFDVTYPEDYGQEKLAGRTVRFHAEVKGVRKKELPELNDEFAKDLGDFENLGELRESVRKRLLAVDERKVERELRDALVEALVAKAGFEVPESLVERHMTARTENTARGLAYQGIDPRKVGVNWREFRENAALFIRLDVC
jgi:trigger factor